MILHVITIILISAVVVVVTSFNIYQSDSTLAQSDSNSIAGDLAINGNAIDLDRPLYKEHYKIISKKEVNGNNMIEVVFSGSGRSGGDVSDAKGSLRSDANAKGSLSYPNNTVGMYRVDTGIGGGIGLLSVSPLTLMGI